VPLPLPHTGGGAGAAQGVSQVRNRSPQAMLSITSLTHVYGNGTRALDAVSLEIPKGMFGLLGPNGAGKSTLMRCLATLQIPTAGAIRFDGIDVLAEPAQLRATLGYLPQDFGVYPRVSAYDLLDHLAVLKGLTGSGERKETVEALLNQVNLWDVRKKAIAGFSGGMRQRWGIAQALIGNPRLLIVDEPTAGLDPEERNRFNNLLAEIGESKVVLLSTHIVGDVTDLCSRMAILVGGRIVATGTPADLIDAVRGRIWTRPVEPEEIPSLRKQFALISTQLRGGRHVINVLADHAPDPRFEPVDAGLEDVYFSTLHAHRNAADAAAAAAAIAA
jgi:ABC-type multidrug transport system ATPase subunit